MQQHLEVRRVFFFFFNICVFRNNTNQSLNGIYAMFGKRQVGVEDPVACCPLPTLSSTLHSTLELLTLLTDHWRSCPLQVGVAFLWEVPV